MVLLYCHQGLADGFVLRGGEWHRGLLKHASRMLVTMIEVSHNFRIRVFRR